jgi:hypothetical protein
LPLEIAIIIVIINHQSSIINHHQSSIIIARRAPSLSFFILFLAGGADKRVSPTDRPPNERMRSERAQMSKPQPDIT